MRFLLLILVILSFGCQKEYPYPSKEYKNVLPTSGGYDTTKLVSRWGKFVIIDAIMYVDNHETGETVKFNHFGLHKDESSLRWGGSIFDIETIVKDKTTYSFWPTLTGGNGMGRFVLNDDTTKYYMVNYMGQNTSIIEDPIHGQQNLGGSARPFFGKTISKADNIISIEIQHMEGSIYGYNCHYWTELKLKKIEVW